jgi:hypothetical protein
LCSQVGRRKEGREGEGRERIEGVRFLILKIKGEHFFRK